MYWHVSAHERKLASKWIDSGRICIIPLRWHKLNDDTIVKIKREMQTNSTIYSVLISSTVRFKVTSAMSRLYSIIFLSYRELTLE